MATLLFDLYANPSEEVQRLAGTSRPEWVDRILQSHHAAPGQAPLSSMLEALGESLSRRLDAAALVARKAEGRGWNVALADQQVRIACALPADRMRAELERDGTWHLAQRLAGGAGVAAVLD